MVQLSRRHPTQTGVSCGVRGSWKGFITVLRVRWTAGTDWTPRAQQDVEVLGVIRVADQLYITLA